MEAIIRRAELAGEPRRIGRAGSAAPPPGAVAPAATASEAPAVAASAAVSPAPQPERDREATRAVPDVQALRTEALAAALATVRREQQAVLQEQLTQHKLEHEAALAGLEEARRELDAAAGTTMAEAREEGLAQGAAQAQDAARAELAHALAAARAVVSALDGERAAMAAGQEDMLVEIVFSAVCRLLGAQAATRAGVTAQVRSLLAQQAAANALAVHLHPADAELLHAAGSLGAQVQVVADPAVELGGCLLVGERGTLDARLELQLDALRATLLDVRAQRAGGGGD